MQQAISEAPQVTDERASHRPILFLLFLISGFCGLLYQVIWTRLAFAAFGIITPVLSIVISVFMLGLGLGAWAAGRSVAALVRRTGVSAAAFYPTTNCSPMAH